MKIAHFADVHLGRLLYRIPSTEWDCYNSFLDGMGKAIDRGAELILISGDLFDSNSPKPILYAQACKVLEMAKDQEIPVIAIYGNHDKGPYNISPIHVLERAGYLIVLDFFTPSKGGIEINEKRYLGGEVKLKQISYKKEKLYYLRFYETGDLRIFGIGYRDRTAIGEILKDRVAGEILSSLAKSSEKSILMVHQGISAIGDKVGLPQMMYEIEYLNNLPSGFSYYALGHLHVQTTRCYGDGIAVYPGAMGKFKRNDCTVSLTNGKLSFRENRKLGFAMVDLDLNSPKVNFVPVSGREIVYMEFLEKDPTKLLNLCEEGYKRCLEVLEEKYPEGKKEDPVVVIGTRGSIDPNVLMSRFRNKGLKAFYVEVLHKGEETREGVGIMEQTKSGIILKTLEEIEKEVLGKYSDHLKGINAKEILEILGRTKIGEVEDPRIKDVYNKLISALMPNWKESEKEIKEERKKEKKAEKVIQKPLFKGGDKNDN